MIPWLGKHGVAGFWLRLCKCEIKIQGTGAGVGMEGGDKSWKPGSPSLWQVASGRSGEFFTITFLFTITFSSGGNPDGTVVSLIGL